jgi:hypothetical protein
MMTEDVTDPVVRIRRAFDAAFLRMCAAKNPEVAEDELSNLLSQIYRLGELVKKRKFGGNNKRFNAALCGTLEGSTARATLWARTFDTHDAVVVGKMGDVFSDFFTEMFGILVWRPLTDLPEQSSKYGQHDDYATYLAGRAVLDTARLAFDTLATMA